MKIKASDKLNICTLELEKIEFDWLCSFLQNIEKTPEDILQLALLTETAHQVHPRFDRLLQAAKEHSKHTDLFDLSVALADLLFLTDVMEQILESSSPNSVVSEEILVKTETYCQELSTEYTRHVMEKGKKPEGYVREKKKYKSRPKPEDPNAISLQVIPYAELELGCGQPRPSVDTENTNYKYFRHGEARPVRITMTKDNLVSFVEGPFCEKANDHSDEVIVLFECDEALMRDLRQDIKLVPISKIEFLDLYKNYKGLVNLPPEADRNYAYYCFAGFRPIRALKTQHGAKYAEESPSYESGGKLRFDLNLSKILWKEDEVETISKEEFVNMCKNYMGYMATGKGIRYMLQKKLLHVTNQSKDKNFTYYSLDDKHPVKIIHNEKWDAIGIMAPSYESLGETWLTKLYEDRENCRLITLISKDQFFEMCK